MTNTNPISPASLIKLDCPSELTNNYNTLAAAVNNTLAQMQAAQSAMQQVMPPKNAFKITQTEEHKSMSERLKEAVKQAQDSLTRK